MLRGGHRGPEEPGASGNDTDADLGQAEPGRARGDDEVAREHDLEAAAEGGTLDRCDKRLAPPTSDDAVLATARRGVVTTGGQVAARTEHVGAAGQDPGPEVLIVVELVEGVIESVRRRPVDGVPLLGPIQGDDQYPALTAPSDELPGVIGVLTACPFSRWAGKRGSGYCGTAQGRQPCGRRPRGLGVPSAYSSSCRLAWRCVRPRSTRTGRHPASAQRDQVPDMATTGLFSGLPPMDP